MQLSQLDPMMQSDLKDSKKIFQIFLKIREISHDFARGQLSNPTSKSLSSKANELKNLFLDATFQGESNDVIGFQRFEKNFPNIFGNT